MHSELPTAIPSTNNAHWSLSSRKPATKAHIEEQSCNEIENMSDPTQNPFVQNLFDTIFQAHIFLFSDQIISDDFVVVPAREYFIANLAVCRHVQISEIDFEGKRKILNLEKYIKIVCV